MIIPATRTPAWDGGEVRWLGDDEAYWRLLADLWAAGETFTIVEHDISPTPDALASFDDCPGDWCACPYPYLNLRDPVGLGCVRFRTALMSRQPDLMEVVACMSDAAHPPKHWCRNDAWMTETLLQRGEPRCSSHPWVEHRVADEDSTGHGCWRRVNGSWRPVL